MTPDTIVEIGKHALHVTALLAAASLLPALLVGLLVAVFQAATQINEMTLSFIPKLMVMALVLALAGPWMLRLLISFTRELVTSIPEIIA